MVKPVLSGGDVDVSAETAQAAVLRSGTHAEAYLAPTASLNTGEMLQELRAAIAVCLEGGDTKVVIDLSLIHISEPTRPY